MTSHGDAGVQGADAVRLALYGDVDLNLLDGSAIWLSSLVEVLARSPRLEMTVVLKAPPIRDLLVGRLRGLDRVHLVDPTERRRTRAAALVPSEAVDVLQDLDAQQIFNIILLRGHEVIREAARRGCFDQRLWLYYLPPGPEELLDVDELQGSLEQAEHVLCQTEAVRSFLEQVVPAAAAKCILLPPMVAPVEARSEPTRGTRPQRLLYAGKFSPEYCFLEMVELFTQLRHELPDLELHVAGDKIHNPPGDPAFKPAVERALVDTPGLIWHGALSRTELHELQLECDLALSVRSPALNDSLELSTKVLEYGAAQLPVVLNRTPLYESVLGPEYPLYVSQPHQAARLVAAALQDRDALTLAAGMASRASERYMFDAVYEQIHPFVERSSPAGTLRVRERKRLLVAGHDLKFLEPLLDRFIAAGLDVSIDKWTHHNTHDPERSADLLDRAEVVLCEWCLGNAVWFSRHVRSDQRLLIRFHRVELTTKYVEEVDISAVAGVGFVAPHVLREMHDRLGWPDEKLHVVPNWVDVYSLDRAKLDGAQFNLGLLGYVPKLKRLDRALDILELLRVHEPRFRLIVKGRPPQETPWVWKQEDERYYFESQLRRINGSSLLRNAVTFEGFGPVPAWFRKVGGIVSVSDIEGNQVAVAEGMASAAVPVVIDRPGARDLYNSRWVHDGAEAAAASLLQLARSDSLRSAGQEAKAQARVQHSPERVVEAWLQLIMGEATEPRRLRTTEALVGH